jgi:two-component system chemotaxis response regulator CheY
MSKTIMIVDDSATMVMSLTSYLEHNGFKAVKATDGLDALSQLKSGPKPDLIITDVNMPNSVKALPGFRFTPILTLTTESQVEKRDEAKRLGATGWLTKPLAGSELIKIIKQVLPAA